MRRRGRFSLLGGLPWDLGSYFRTTVQLNRARNRNIVARSPKLISSLAIEWVALETDVGMLRCQPSTSSRTPALTILCALEKTKWKRELSGEPRRPSKSRNRRQHSRSREINTLRKANIKKRSNNTRKPLLFMDLDPCITLILLQRI